ncbi:uncharacterized protein TRIADDRAFT_60797 [Trichoplax adhaerens]|uniref:Guanylate-binding protein N-terminal domain-containing protein n=1 Tax=Trichoplax adhaerens TaxID=10228 RepID=B3S8Z4_TRIAD|nr:hypothetical protein TRIADDRAFT_60797 [Trichoplax adhaerens]EDV20856.1 hypothetical protein TRIADDRAFT_60797 [Trichoplax adhaerens]|eukprot:XP_002116797.1 hypothetical protein TRIADDRAFT_60797 [Trichoplax adhaerens]
MHIKKKTRNKINLELIQRSPAVPLITVERKTGQVKVHEKNIDHVLKRPEFKNTHVVVIGILGQHRAGKSFLMNVIRLYLLEKVKKMQELSTIGKLLQFLSSEPRWLTAANFRNIQSQFGWYHSDLSDTKGIYTLREPILCQNAKGQKVAVVLLDTDGSIAGEFNYDNIIYILTSILSSKQILNFRTECQDDEIRMLKVLEEYLNYATDKSHTKLLQDVAVIIRDAKVKKKELGQVENYQMHHFDQNSQVMMPVLNSHYCKVQSYLFPHPTAGRRLTPISAVKVLDENHPFAISIDEFCSTFLAPENFIQKSFFRIKINCYQLADIIKVMANLFQSGKLPTPELLYEGIVKTLCEYGLDSVVMDYEKHAKYMEDHFGTNNIPAEQLKKLKAALTKVASHYFKTLRSSKCNGIIERSRERTEKKLEALHSSWQLKSDANCKKKTANHQAKERTEVNQLYMENVKLKKSLSLEKANSLKLQLELDEVRSKLSEADRDTLNQRRKSWATISHTAESSSNEDINPVQEQDCG